MSKYLFIIIAFAGIFGSCSKSTSVDGLFIDKNIKTEVEKHIENLKEENPFGDKMLVYGNSIFIESFENDKLNISTMSKPVQQVFKSFYYWKKDTLNIDGAFGLFTGFGFAIKIHKNKAILYHMLSSDEMPGYAYNLNNSLKFRLEVPCTDTKMILSEIPDSTKKQIIYGYVEFKSKDYFSTSGSMDGKELVPRKKQRDNMRIYFKSSKFNL